MIERALVGNCALHRKMLGFWHITPSCTDNLAQFLLYERQAA